MEFGDLFSFDKRIGPAIVKPLYWILLLLIVVLGVIYFLTGFFGLFTTGFFYGLWMMITSVISVAVGVPILRVLTEVAIAVFEVQDRASGSGTTPTQM